MIRLLFSFLAKKIYKDSFNELRISVQNTYGKASFEFQNDILEKLLISGEDHRFKYHIGFDIIAIVRAIRNRIFYNRLEGASTIEQQLVRVLLNDFEKSFKRKIREIFLSTTLTEIVPRNKIPSIYLHVAYYGVNMIGLKEIFTKFKITHSNQITKDIAAEIISRIKYPESGLANNKRFAQIELRKQHLLNLYHKHNLRKIITVYG